MTREDINSTEWLEGYRDAQRAFLADNRRHMLARLERMGILALPRDSRILDFGCGDGTLGRILAEQGFDNVMGMEPDARLVVDAKRSVRAMGPLLPWASDAFDGVISMAVLHHLPNEAAIANALREFARVLKPGGVLGCCEPADTLARAVLTPLLLSPLGRLTRFSRQKRLMVLAERETLEHWLRIERDFVAHMLPAAGFVVEGVDRGPLKTCVRARRLTPRG